ncbi:hypothetical protein BDZ94DRAFT_1305298 [Collybia nuda]|uniref:Yeast cell wall synthesis Kre9/Knh1-like N-terminal domain-containing protein n=1 Tax=Collybia nuda TaxID=64659 RepID=A0A9P6CIR7_9AGAR|nr:hypothetical protein BDZ94DRAFT_1305298 [Collybia nuda]
MYPTTLALALAFWFLNLALLVDAGIFVVKPSQGSLCHGGKKCTIEWLDDGTKPLLTSINICKLGLYTGKQQLVQTIQPVDVSKAHSVTFIPIPDAGPNSDTYYISLISTSAKRNDSIPYAAFSPSFRIDQMTGSFDTPLASAIAPIPIPASLSSPSASVTNTVSTITVGTLSTSLPPLPSLTEPTSTGQPSLTRLSTSVRPSSTPAPLSSETGTPAPTATLSSSALSRTPSLGAQLPVFICVTLLALRSFL